MPSGFVEVSGYSQTDLDNAYNQGVADGTGQLISLSASEGGSKTATVTKTGRAYYTAFTVLSGSDASAKIYRNNTVFYSSSGSHDGREETGYVDLVAGDTVRATCNDVSGTQRIHAVIHIV